MVCNVVAEFKGQVLAKALRSWGWFGFLPLKPKRFDL